MICWGHIFLLPYSDSSSPSLVARQTSAFSAASPEPFPKSPLAEEFQTFVMMSWTGLPFSSLSSLLFAQPVCPFYNANHNMSFSVLHHWYSMSSITDTLSPPTDTVSPSSLIEWVLHNWYSVFSITDTVSPSSLIQWVLYHWCSESFIADTVSPPSLIQWVLPSLIIAFFPAVCFLAISTPLVCRDRTHSSLVSDPIRVNAE